LIAIVRGQLIREVGGQEVADYSCHIKQLPYGSGLDYSGS